MLATISTWLAAYVVPAVLGWVSAKIHTWYVNFQQEQAIQKQNQDQATIVKETGRPT